MKIVTLNVSFASYRQVNLKNRILKKWAPLSSLVGGVQRHCVTMRMLNLSSALRGGSKGCTLPVATTVPRVQS
jgi:hypothetical protein